MKKEKKVLLLGIDFQNDFVKEDGALSVNGAVDDAKRTTQFIKNNGHKISDIIFSMDSHYPNHIAHPNMWVDKEGNHPSPFTIITHEDTCVGKWAHVVYDWYGKIYTEKLEAKGKVHTIWNPHCIFGTEGWCLYKDIYEALSEWSIKYNNDYNLEIKGTNPNLEHYSLFKPEVTFNKTNLVNHELLTRMVVYDEIIIVGEARSHCVLNSIKDILEYGPISPDKLIVFEDCMSNVVDGVEEVENFYKEIKEKGVKIIKSSEYE